MDILERKLQLLEQGGWFSDVAKRQEALDRLIPTVRAASDPVVRDLYLGRVAERVGIGRDTLQRELRERPGPRPEAPPPPEPNPGGHSRRPPERRVRHPGARQERALLQVILATPAWRARGLEEFQEEDFEVPVYRAVFAALRRVGAAGDLGDAARVLPEEAVPAFAQLREYADAAVGLDLDREYEGAAERLRERAEFRRVRTIADPEERRRIVAGWPVKMQERYVWQRARERAQRPQPQ
jgi:DNA primase